MKTRSLLRVVSIFPGAILPALLFPPLRTYWIVAAAAILASGQYKQSGK